MFRLQRLVIEKEVELELHLVMKKVMVCQVLET